MLFNVVATWLLSGTTVASLLGPLPRTSTNLGLREVGTGVPCACNTLRQKYPDLLLLPNATTYAAESTNFWDKRSNMNPACIFLPINATEVADALKVISSCKAQFAVRAGGHMNIPGSNNIDGGVLLALNRLTHLKAVGNGELIEAGPGNRWIDIYNALDPYGRYAIGGRGKTIGISGLSLIGGFHYFNNKYGFAMDNVVSYDVVLGNGTQVIANATSHPDLFWALKGGANNFGVVTRFIYKTFEARQISTTIQSFDESAIPAFIKAVCDFVEADDPSVAAGGVVTIQKNATTKSISARIMGVQEGAISPPPRFANFSTISATSRFHNVTTPKIWHAALESPFQMFRNTYGQHAIKPDSDAIYGMYKQWRDAVDDISDVKGLYPTFILNMSPKSSARVAKTNGIGNTWGLDDSVDEIWWQFSTGWDHEEDDLRVTSWTRSLLARLHSENRAKKLASSEFVYMGDAAETQNVFAGFPAENIERMREIRGRYDELGVFTKLNWGGFKLGY